jgi:hypothetical protein
MWENPHNGKAKNFEISVGISSNLLRAYLIYDTDVRRPDFLGPLLIALNISGLGAS